MYGEAARSLKTRWKGGDPDLPFRRGQAGKSSIEGRIPGGCLLSVFQGRGAPVCGGMCAESKSPFHENALGGPRRGVKSVNVAVYLDREIIVPENW